MCGLDPSDSSRSERADTSVGVGVVGTIVVVRASAMLVRVSVDCSSGSTSLEVVDVGCSIVEVAAESHRSGRNSSGFYRIHIYIYIYIYIV